MNSHIIVGLIFGKFYPLHTGHIYLIQRAYSKTDQLHIIMGYDEKRDYKLFLNSSMSKKPTINDRLRWLLQTFKYQKNIFIHTIDENNINPYPYGWKQWSIKIKKFLKQQNIKPHYIYTSEKQDIKNYKMYLNIQAIIIDADRNFIDISATKIRKDPFRYWKFIPTEVKPFFVRTVALLGGESSGKSILIHKLASIFNTTSAWEFGRKYIFSNLGGDERALQYSDYDKIALGQARYINTAIRYANKVTFIDTEFITTQAFCKKYQGKFHPFVQALINEYHFDLVILLENNTPWIADGLRRLGNIQERKEFQKILIYILKYNNISYVHIKNKNYDSRLLICIKLVQEILGISHK